MCQGGIIMEWDKTEYQKALDNVIDSYDQFRDNITKLEIPKNNKDKMLADIKVMRKEAIMRLEDHYI